MDFKKIPTQIWVLVLVVILGVGFSVVFFSRDDGSPSEEVSATARDEAAIMERVTKHYKVPDEDPLISEIKDIDLLLAESPFYRGATNGDYLILFPKTRKALVYSFNRDVLINAGPVQFDDSGTPGSEVDRAITIEVRNGTGVGGAAGSLGRQLENNVRYSVISVDDAANTDYTETLVVNRTGSSVASHAESIADTVSGRVVGSLPLDEANSIADIVIIIGGTQ